MQQITEHFIFHCVVNYPIREPVHDKWERYAREYKKAVEDFMTTTNGNPHALLGRVNRASKKITLFLGQHPSYERDWARLSRESLRVILPSSL